jgi:hypothetical protein
MAAGDLNVLLPAFFSSPESLGEVRRRTIFRTPSSYFQEASRVRMRPASSLFTPRLLTNIENVV